MAVLRLAKRKSEIAGGIDRLNWMFWRLLGNSLLVAGFGTLLASALGIGCALAVLGCRPMLRRLAIAAAIVVLVLPPFLVTNCWLHFLGLTGPWREWWPFDIYSYAGVAWVFALTFWPIPFLLCLASWEKVDATLFEVEPALSGGKLVRWLLWPSARRAILYAALITFALLMNQFSVPAILQVRVLPAELWLRLSTQLDLIGAVKASVPSILVTVLLLATVRAREIAWPRLRGVTEGGVARRQLGWLWGFCMSGLALTLFFALALPLSQIGFAKRTWADLPQTLPVARSAIGWTSVYAAVGAALAVVLGLLTRKQTAVGPVAWLLFITPGVLLGSGLAYVLPSAVTSVLVALGVRYFALVWQAARVGMSNADAALADVVRLESSSRWSLLRHAYWPQIRPVILAAGYLCYVLALWDVETLILIYPPGGETLAIRVFNLLHYGHIGQVNALCLILLALALAPAAGWTLWRWFLRCKS